MADIVSPAKRSLMMAGIKGKNTKPEILIRSALHRKGFRFRIHQKSLPGNPDLVFPKYKAVVFVHGCFWHGHTCSLFKMPSTRTEFWENKIAGNRSNDAKKEGELRASGWRILVIWECSLRGKMKLPFDEVIEKSTNWLISSENHFEIKA